MVSSLFVSENPLPNSAVSDLDRVLRNYTPYSARFLPFCSSSTIRLPICQQASPIAKLTAVYDFARAACKTFWMSVTRALEVMRRLYAR